MGHTLVILRINLHIWNAMFQKKSSLLVVEELFIAFDWEHSELLRDSFNVASLNHTFKIGVSF